MNKGISVKGANEKIYVDFGYIRPKNSKIIPCKDVIIQDITKRINTNKYASSKEVSDLTKAQNIFLYGDEVSTDFIETKSLTSPEIQFYNETNNTIKNYILSEKEIPKETQKRLQKLYKSIGGIGNACILIKSCKQ
jgi:GTP-dependent phosphoenolpyruvate carboxykinase